MKKLTAIFLVLILSATFNLVKGQNFFSLNELKNLCDSSSIKFETYVIQKGYSYSSNYSTDEVGIYLNATARPNGIKDQISRSDFGHGTPVSIEFRTTDKDFYQKFKTALDSAGFKYEMKTPRKIGGVNAVWYRYSNSKYRATIYSYLLSNGVESYVCNIEKK